MTTWEGPRAGSLVVKFLDGNLGLVAEFPGAFQSAVVIDAGRLRFKNRMGFEHIVDFKDNQTPMVGTLVINPQVAVPLKLTRL